MSQDHLRSAMDHDSPSDDIINARNTTRGGDQDQHDAMEVDSALPTMIDTNQSQDAGDTASVRVGLQQSHDLRSSVASTSTAGSTSREPPAFDDDTERPRQRRRFHVTVEDEIDPEVRTGTDSTTVGTRVDEVTEDDETTVLESAPPRMSELSIATPPITTEGEQATMLDILPDTSTPIGDAVAPVSANQGDQSPHMTTIPLPDVPPPPSDPNAPPGPVIEAARRLNSAPTANHDQMQADLALLAPYIAAQAIAAAFPMGGGRPPPAGDTNAGGTPAQAPGEANDGAPPPPFPFGFAPFMFGAGGGELPADPKRAERLANGLKVVEDGLLKRWKTVCGEEGAVCAVCYSELLEEPGIEKEKEHEKAQDAEEGTEAKEQSETGQDAHEKALRDMLKRRELMEKLEKEEKERELENAVLAFPCGHVFHRTCLLPWLSRHTTCPACRFDIDPKSDTLNLPADDGMPFSLGANGFNFGDLFTVGPVLRVPRAQAPGGLNPRHAHDHHGHNHTHEHGNTPSRPNLQRVSTTPGGGGTNTEAPSIADMFDILLGSLLQSAGLTLPPRQPPTPQATQPAPESSETAAPTEVPTPTAVSTSTVASAPTTEAAASSAPTSPTSTTLLSEIDYPTNPPARPPPVPQRAAEPRRQDDRDRPVAMFGRHTHRRPPQPITPAWMRPPRPAAAAAPATSAGASGTTSGSTAGPSSSAVGPPTLVQSAPAAPPAPPARASLPSREGHRPSLGQLRAMVSNLIPRRLGSSGRASGTPSVRSNRSTESAGSTSASRNAPRSVSGPTSPRSTGLRAIFQGPTTLFRELTGNRRSETGSMPDLESESEGSTFSEDAADSGDDDDMPGLEPITRRHPVPAFRQTALEWDDDDGPPPLEAIPRHESQGGTGANQPGARRPPASDAMDNLITLRIDLGHADGRDETIIVPLLFNPNGRAGAQPQTGDAPPAVTQAPPPTQRARTPPPQKKWTPPEAVKTFRQVVEEKEREAGWRCDDPACLLGPADDEEPSDEPHINTLRFPIMRSVVPEGPTRHKVEDGIRVYADGEDFRVQGENPVCEHTLHAECLVTSARVNGWGPEHNAGPNSRVTLRCPMCRAEGTVDRQVWDAGVEAETGEPNQE